jgi:molecular chaperone GrpE
MNKASKKKVDNTINENENNDKINENNIDEKIEIINKENNEDKVISPEIMEQINYLNNKFEEKTKEYEEKILHLKKENLANLDNQKKQYEKDFENVKKYMFQKFFEEILIVGDSLEVGIKAKQENYEKFIDGLKMTFGIYVNTLKKYQVEIIDVKIGDDFNDQFHECMGTSEEGENNKIVNILSTGYKYGDRTIRPTKVIVGTKC